MTKFKLVATVVAFFMLFLQIPANASNVNGSGSSFIFNFLNTCKADYAKETGNDVNYNPLGSGSGLSMFVKKTVDFAATDVPFPPGMKVTDKFVYVPLVAGPIAIAYNLQGYNKPIRLKKTTLAKIFAGDITKWNDPEIVSDNTINKIKPKLPNKPIMVVYRSDSSGTTQVFTEYLWATNAKIWNKLPSKSFTQAFPKSNLPIGTFVSAPGTSLVATTVARTDGAIAYMESSFATNQKLSKASIENNTGKFIQPTVQGASEFLSKFTILEDGSILSNYNNPNPKAYNISTFSYGLAWTSKSETNLAVKDFFKYVVGPCSKNNAVKLEYSPLTGDILKFANKQISQIGG